MFCFFAAAFRASGHEVFRVEVHPRKQFRLEAVDNSLSDINYFKYEELDNRTVAIKLAYSLEDLVDRVSLFLSLRSSFSLYRIQLITITLIAVYYVYPSIDIFDIISIRFVSSFFLLFIFFYLSIFAR